jgi:hypothetical protein
MFLEISIVEVFEFHQKKNDKCISYPSLSKSFVMEKENVGKAE